jgi:hypothetical protein
VLVSLGLRCGVVLEVIVYGVVTFATWGSIS